MPSFPEKQRPNCIILINRPYKQLSDFVEYNYRFSEVDRIAANKELGATANILILSLPRVYNYTHLSCINVDVTVNNTPHVAAFLTACIRPTHSFFRVSRSSAN